MDTFDEWLSSTQHVSVRKYSTLLTEQGASWDTFLLRDPEAIANDLIKDGVPRLAAWEIVEAASVAAKQRQAPMAVFWDLENMPIPATSSGRDVSSRLKSILKPYGELVQFRGYASIGLNLIPQQKRSDLQLSGCLLVDCPHNGRKEVADKMIIVDALHFAMENAAGATLCFVTGDVDYAYLLAVLQRYKQYRTIVISKGTLQSMLDVNCDMKMRWETDILQLRSAPLAWTNTVEDLGLPSRDSSSIVSDDPDRTLNDTFEPLTADEEWIDDVEFLRNVIRRESLSSGSVLKSMVGNLLRQTNPARFPHRESVQLFLSQAIDKGVIWEAGDGGFKEVGLPIDETTGMFPAISLSAQIPMPLADIPPKVIHAAAQRPYVIFIKWKFCPPGTNLPSKAFVQHKDSWGFLMFSTLTDAQRTASEYPWLRNGLLVDWKKVNTDDLQVKTGTKFSHILSATASTAETACGFCRAIREDVELQRHNNGFYACPECIEWDVMSDDKKEEAASKVVDFLQLLAANDDITVPEAILRKQLHLKEEFGCKSRKWGALWIKQAVEMGLVTFYKPPNNPKAKIVCLASNLRDASRPFPPDDFDTTVEENAVLEMLWKDGKGWVNRLEVIQTLKEKFPHMNHPYLRTKVLQDSHKKGRIYLSKGTYGQAVGLSAEDADLGLASFRHKNKLSEEIGGELESTEDVNSGDGRDSDSDSSDNEDSLRRFAGLTQK